jgi:exodeoxyribonuclease V
MPLPAIKRREGNGKMFLWKWGYIPQDKPDTEYYRWLYTALTRATRNLYLMGFSEDFF